MLYLIGGPPRVGKSTLAALVLQRDAISNCPTDLIVSMLSAAAPQLGVRHGKHPDKAATARPFIVEFCRAFANGDGRYVVEGDVVDPVLARAVTAAGVAVRAVFLGHTALTPEELRIAPHWLDGAEDDQFAEVAGWVSARSQRLHVECRAFDHAFVDMAAGREEGLEIAYRALRSTE